MAEQLAFNMDCMLAIKGMPDNAFDLAVVDPPYGAGLGEGGGGKGWFTKYNQSCSQTVNVERERERQAAKPLRFHGGDRWDKYLNDNPNRGGLGRRSTEKNHRVGHSAGDRVF